MIKLNGEVVKVERFPNGEARMKNLLIRGEREHVEMRYEDDSDLFLLMLLKKHLDSGISKSAHLTIPYMPYSRQDRVEHAEEVFTLKYVAEIINSLKFDSVNIWEPHSDVTMALVDRSYASYPTVTLLPQVFFRIGASPALNFTAHNGDIIFFPDAGAAKRYSSKIPFPYLVGYKDRDFATGKIKSFQIVGNAPEKPFRALIIDDLCSYGGTFLLAGEALRKLGAVEVYLFVTHCEKSVFAGGLLMDSSPINKVFCTNSIVTQGDIERMYGQDMNRKIEIV